MVNLSGLGNEWRNSVATGTKKAMVRCGGGACTRRRLNVSIYTKNQIFLAYRLNLLFKGILLYQVISPTPSVMMEATAIKEKLAMTNSCLL